MFTLHNGDCLPFMRSLPDKAFDLIATDPPYGVTSHEWDCLFKQEWLDEMIRISKHIAVINAARPDVVAHMLSLSPMADRLVIWRQPVVKAGHGMIWSWQPIYIWNDGFKMWDTINIPVEKKYTHPTQKPIALMKKIISSIECETVFDPFSGSGTTLVSALELGKVVVGCEQSPEFYSIAKARCEQAALQQRLFTPSNNRLHSDVGDSPAQQALFTPEAGSAKGKSPKPAPRQ